MMAMVTNKTKQDKSACMNHRFEAFLLARLVFVYSTHKFYNHHHNIVVVVIMQGPPTTPLLAPPLKKVRAEAATAAANVASTTTTPLSPNSHRRDQLTQIQKGLTNYSRSSAHMGAAGGPPLGGAGVGVGAPPLGVGSSTAAYAAAGGPPPLGVGVGGPPPRGATSSSAAYTPSNNPNPSMLNRYSAYTSSSYATASSSGLPPDSGPPPPAIPGRSGPAAAMRTSDIFPSVPKTAMSNIGSSMNNSSMGSSSSSMSSAPSSSMSMPPVARRLDDSLAQAQSSGAPPRPGVGFVGGGRPPPPRPKVRFLRY
jgi:hypothetical protein